MNCQEKETRRRVEIMLAVKYDENDLATNVEYMNIANPSYGWNPLKVCEWNWCSCDYRIVPKPEQPQYIPYDFSDAEEIIGMKIKSKNRNRVTIVMKVSNEPNRMPIYICDENYFKTDSQINYLSYEKLFEQFVKLDGTPCGKLKK